MLLKCYVYNKLIRNEAKSNVKLVLIVIDMIL